MEMTGRNGEKLNIPSNLSQRDINESYLELLSLMDEFYYMTEKVDLINDTVCILQSAGHPEAVSQVMSWSEYLEMSSRVFSEEQNQYIFSQMSAENLLRLFKSGQKFHTVNAQYLKDNVLNNTTSFIVFKCENGIPYAYIMIRNSSREHLRKRMVELYVYNNCDFFIYLDAINNAYTMFDAMEDGRQEPPKLYADYAVEIEKYVNEIVVPEDREKALRELSVPQILQHLEKRESHSFYCGVMDAAKGYTRKRFEYRYYVRSTKAVLLSCTDVTEMYLQEKEQRRALFDALQSARTDMLTGVMNFKGIVESISEALEEKPEQAAFLFIDIDNFKVVNDSLGHDVGDDVLCEIASILCREAFGEPLIGRYGGDEFVIFFKNIKSMDSVRAYAKRVCEVIEAMEYGQKENTPHISCSIGIVEVPKHGTDYKTLVKKADEMLYRAKQTGKNRYVIYE